MQPCQQAALHVAGSWTRRAIAVAPERPLRRCAETEHRVHVPDEQQTRARPLQPANYEVAELGLAIGGLVGDALDIRSKVSKLRLDVRRDGVDALWRVRPAVDVDELLELGEVSVKSARHGLAQRAQ